jgi:hypothetical protein
MPFQTELNNRVGGGRDCALRMIEFRSDTSHRNTLWAIIDAGSDFDLRHPPESIAFDHSKDLHLYPDECIIFQRDDD